MTTPSKGARTIVSASAWRGRKRRRRLVALSPRNIARELRLFKPRFRREPALRQLSNPRQCAFCLIHLGLGKALSCGGFGDSPLVIGWPDAKQRLALAYSVADPDVNPLDGSLDQCADGTGLECRNGAGGHDRDREWQSYRLDELDLNGRGRRRNSRVGRRRGWPLAATGD